MSQVRGEQVHEGHHSPPGQDPGAGGGGVGLPAAHQLGLLVLVAPARLDLVQGEDRLFTRPPPRFLGSQSRDRTHFRKPMKGMVPYSPLQPCPTNHCSIPTNTIQEYILAANRMPDCSS